MFLENRTINYGLEMMAYLSSKNTQAPVSLGDIAQERNLSRKYLERIALRLKQAGLVNVKSGRSGGYQLAKNPAQISSWEVITALQGEATTGVCSECVRAKDCTQGHFWATVRQELEQTFQSKTLSDLISK